MLYEQRNGIPIFDTLTDLLNRGKGVAKVVTGVAENIEVAA